MKITKSPKRLAPATPEVLRLQDRITNSTDDELPAVLDGISEWCWPRGDLYYWTGVLNRFDSILETVCKDYDLSSIQMTELTPLTKRLVVSIVRFSRLLIENCTNRKLYNSFEHLDSLLYTCDLDVLTATLRLVLRVAQQHTSHHPRHDFQISKEKLTTLAVIWTPRDHNLSLVDIAKQEMEAPADLSHVRFQFFKRSSQSALPPTTAAAAQNQDSDTPVSTPQNQDRYDLGTPTRPRHRDGRLAMLTASSASNLPSTPTRTDDRGEGASSQHLGSNSDPSSSRREGLVTVDLGRIGSTAKKPADILAQAITTYEIPKEEQFELFQRIRLATSLSNTQARHQLLVCRLLAIACYGLVIGESTANTQIFLYEPDLIARIAALVDPVEKVDMAISSSAFYALDSLGRYRNKVNLVLNAVNASVNHGIILSVCRSLVDDLKAPESHCSDHYVDSILSFVAFVCSVSAGSQMIVGAGLIPVLVELVKIPAPNRYLVQRTVSRSIGIIDSLAYAIPHAFELFCNAQGLDVVVQRIQEEVDRDIEEISTDRMQDSVFGEPGPDNLYGMLAFGRASLLRSMFKSITQMMTSTGTGDGLRNLINTSLPMSLKKIIQHREIFGPQILGHTINIMATFIHNEPTSLAILQEAKLPEAFFDAIDADIEANFEVILAIPNAIGAICLNQAGLDLFNSRQTISKLFSLFTSERHSKVFQDRDNATVFGSAIDELVRHQPSIKDSVLQSVIRCLVEIDIMGRKFVAPEDSKSRAAYGLLPVGDTAGPDQPIEENTSIGASVALADVVAEEPATNNKDESKVESNPVIVSIDVTARFLEGLFQTTSHCKDFLKLDGLDRLLALYSLPCLPYDFSNSMTADSLVTLIRFMAEISPSTVLIALLRDVKTVSAEATSVFGLSTSSFSSMSFANGTSRLLPLATPRDDAQAAAANITFRKLVALSSICHLLSDVCQTFSYAGHKMPSTFLQTLVSSDSSKGISIAELGALYRACSWESMLLKASLPSPPKSNFTEGEEPAKDRIEASAHADSADNQGINGSRTSQPAISDNQLPDAVDPLQQNANTSATVPDKVAAEESPRERNAAALRYLATQVPSCLTSMFQDTVRFFAPRRGVDAAHKKVALTASVEIAKTLTEHLAWREMTNDTNSFAFGTLMVCQVSSLLFDERTTPNTIQTAILRGLDKHGGLDAIFDLYRRYTDEIDHFYNANGNRTQPVVPIEEAGLKLAHTCGGLKVILGALLKLSTARGLVDSLQTTQLIKDGGLDVFEPHAYLVKIRAAVLPVLRSTWEKPWLPSLPASVNRLMLQNLLVILKGENEAPKKPTPPTSATHPSGSMNGSNDLSTVLSGFAGLRNPFAFGSTPRSAPVRRAPNEERVQQLVDMGFPINAARHALSRCANNLSAATEYLLTHDDIVVHYRDHPDQAWNEDGDGPEQTASSNTQNEGSATDAGGTVALPSAAGSSLTGSAAALEAQDTIPAGSSTLGDLLAGEAAMDVESQPPATAATADTDSVMAGVDPDSTRLLAQPKDETQDADSVAKLNAALDEQRAAIQATFILRALELADHHAALVFEVKAAILLDAGDKAKALHNIESLTKVVQEVKQDAVGLKADYVALRLQLLALVLHDEQIFKQLEENSANAIFEAVQGLVLLYGSRSSNATVADAAEKPMDGNAIDQKGIRQNGQPKWLASLLLVIVAVLGFFEENVEAKVDDASLETEAEDTASVESDQKHSLPKVRVTQDKTSDELYDFTVQLFREAFKLERNDLLAAYRLLAVLTRNHSFAARFTRDGHMQLVFEPFKVLEPKEVSGCQSFVMIVLRHAVEDAQTLAAVMKQELHSFVAQTRYKITDTSALVRQLDSAVLRDPDVFLESAVGTLKMMDYSPAKGSGQVELIEDTKVSGQARKDSPSDFAGNGQASLASLRLGDDPMEISADTGKSAEQMGESVHSPEKTADDPFNKASQAHTASASSEQLDNLMAFLLGELLNFRNRPIAAPKEGDRASKAANPSQDSEANLGKDGASKPAAANLTSDEQQADISFFYTCFVMQCLTELLSSYTSCKNAFVKYNRKHLFPQMRGSTAAVGWHTPGSKDSSRPRNGILGIFLNDLVPAGFLSSYEGNELRRRMAHSNWAMSVMVALTADITVHVDVKEVSTDLVNIRKTVLDAIARAIKEAASSPESIEIRYGRLFALSDLCYRLLIARPNSTGGKQVEDLTLHMAKTMLEKNFVTVLTSAIADVDLNLPTVKSLLEATLRPLERLTRVAIKMGKAKDRQITKAIPQNSDDDTSLSSDYDLDDDADDDDDEDSIDREETPDFYRNSSLGMHTGEMEQGIDEDELEDEEMEDEDEMEMEEYDSQTGSDMSSEDEDGDDPRVIELSTESDSDMSGSDDSHSDLDSDSDLEGDMDEDDLGDDISMDGTEDRWTDEDTGDEPEDGDDGDDDEALDFVFEDGPPGIPGVIGEGFDDGVEGDEHLAAEDMLDEDGMDMDDDESIDDGLEHEHLSHLELADDYAPIHQGDDRFGANWGWSAPSGPRSGLSHMTDRSRPSSVLPPNFFLPTALENMAGGTGGHRRRTLLDMDSMIAPRRSTAQGDEIASHPLLVDRSESDARQIAGRAGRRGPLDQMPSAYADWAQSIEDIVGDGAMQFLESLLARGGQSQDIRIELGTNGRMRIDGIEMGMAGHGAGHHHHHHHHHHHSGTFAAGGPAGTDNQSLSRRAGRQEAAKNDPINLAQAFTPQPTIVRWAEEALVLLPTSAISNARTHKVRAHLINALLPGFKRRRNQARSQLEEDRKRVEQEKKEKEKRDNAESELKRLREQKQRTEEALEAAQLRLREAESRAIEDRQAPQPAAESAATTTAAEDSAPLATQRSAGDDAAPASGEDVEMVDLERDAPTSGSTDTPAVTEPTTHAPIQSESSVPSIERVTTVIHGEEIDITDTGIDPTFLEALPDDLREEVLNQHFRGRRASETTSVPQTTSIAPEFLDALPPELRAEVIQQEALENSRRQMREQQSAAQNNERAAQGEGAAPTSTAGAGSARNDASVASGRGSSDVPSLLEQVLMERVDEHIMEDSFGIRTAETSGNRRRQHRRFDDDEDESPDQSAGTTRVIAPQGSGLRSLANGIPANGNSARAADADGNTDKKTGPRDAIQLLDKSGLATLVRLLYFPQMNGKQTALHKVLVNLSENSKTRSELLNLLLMVLSEGSVDAHAVDRSFVSMSNRANRMHVTPSRPTPKRALTGPASAAHTHTPGSAKETIPVAPLSRTGDEAPFLIASRSIETLLHLTASNSQAALYFLRDDARPPKRARGKEKEKDKERATAPVNILLALLSKQSILANHQLIDSLLALLSTITKPLLSVPKKESEAQTQAPLTTEAGNADAPSTMGQTSDSPAANTGPAANADAPETSKTGGEGALTVVPVITPDRLSAIVKPLATAVSSKGFQHTLAVASHLSAIEGARDVICGALQAQANEASKSLVGNLDALLSTLPEPVEEDGEEENSKMAAGEESMGNAESHVADANAAGSVAITRPDQVSPLSGPQRIESQALASLASPASAQAILLRSLRALDYIMTGR